jgi:glycosyltransferase involved in cell wall biosynthesis
MAAAHSRGGVAVLAEACPDTPVEYIALGDGIEDAGTPAERASTRAALGCTEADVLFGVFGALTAEKRVRPILTAFASTRAHAPHARLLLAGTPDPSLDLDALMASLGVADAVTVQRGLDDRAFERAMAAVDVALCLRWPSTLETSGPWLLALSAGRPTVTLDLPQQTLLPALDPRTWQPYRSGGDAAPVTVALDILDEAHSLRLALRRLSTDAPLRDRLGRAARDYWMREHTIDRMVADYERVMALAAASPMPAVTLPAGLRPDPFAHARALLAETGSLSCELL